MEVVTIKRAQPAELAARKHKDIMTLHFETFPHVAEIPSRIWNRLAVGASPAMEWEYWHALEKSGAVSAERGYVPCHLVAYEHRQPVAIAPLFERDRAWVEFGDGGLLEFLTGLTGLPFHSGLVGTIPFTPIPGYQFLHHPELAPVRIYKGLLDYIDFLCHTEGLSTSRIYFVVLASPDLHKLLVEQGYVLLRSQYYMWFNREYRSFEDYLKTFKSSRRTKIKRELRTIREQGIDIEMVPGNKVPESYYDDMYQLYLQTWWKHMGTGIRPFLNADFFRILGRTFGHRCSFSVARRAGQTLAMALFYQNGECIFGRYWGCFEEIPFLHFATCYYHPIAYAIERGIRRMDPGFGGEHKLLRGYEQLPVSHYVKFYGEQQRRIADVVLKQMGVVQGTF